jgi:hypothetical protein
VLAGPRAAKQILQAAAQEFPLSTELCILMVRQEVDFWEALRQGRIRQARAAAAALCAMPHPAATTELDIRCAT